jgi:citrate lyase beta subunit
VRLGAGIFGELDERLRPVDAELARRYPGGAGHRQPVHTVYVPADRVTPDLAPSWGAAALTMLREHPPPPFADSLRDRVIAKLAIEPVEDLRVDFEDGYGVRDDADEDAAVRAVAAALREGPPTPFVGLRVKSLEAATRRRAVRTLDLFLDAYGPPPSGFVVTCPKVSHAAQVEAMVLVCGRLEEAYALPEGSLRFEVQVETPPAILGADGTATVARLITAAGGRCAGLHYGTYDYSAACGIAAAQQSLEHPAADHAKAVMQAAAAGTGVPLSDGSTNVLPVGSPTQVRAAWGNHLRLVRRSLERGFYQGWDLHPGQLPTRFAATYAFFRDGHEAAAARLRAYLWEREERAERAPRPRGQDVADRRASGVLDEPATARALAGFLLRGLDCGAVDPDEAGFSRAELAAL